MNKFSNAKDAIAYIEEVGFTKKGLNNYANFLESMGNPQHKLECIHIAGTNGKGSTTNYIRSILQHHGLKVGTFTSPYLIEHNDRIRINDINISDDDILRIINENIEYWLEKELSMFEIDMSISLQYFIEQEVDVAIYEAGIGGRYDVTSLVSAEIGGITNIGMDHTKLLGNSYEEIAYQKAGIIKKGMQVFTTEEKEECIKEFEKEANKVGASLSQVKVADIKNIHLRKEVIFDYKEYKEIELQTIAVFQARNAVLALEISKAYLNKKQIQIKESKIRGGLKETYWKGRMEIVKEHPRVIIDGAHNLEGIKALCESMKENKELAILFGVLKDKDYMGMYKELKKISDDITVCIFDHIRGITLDDIPFEKGIKVSENYKTTIKDKLNKNQDLLICGSLYFISEVRALFEH